MSREPFIVPPGRNKILDTAWKGHKAAQKAEGKKKPAGDHLPDAGKKVAAKAPAKKKAPARKRPAAKKKPRK